MYLDKTDFQIVLAFPYVRHPFRFNTAQTWKRKPKQTAHSTQVQDTLKTEKVKPNPGYPGLWATSFFHGKHCLLMVRIAFTCSERMRNKCQRKHFLSFLWKLSGSFHLPQYPDLPQTGVCAFTLTGSCSLTIFTCLFPEENSYLWEHFLFLKKEREFGGKKAKLTQGTSNFNAHLKGCKGVSEHLNVRPLTSISKLSKKPKNDPSKSLDHDVHFPTDGHGIKTYF